MAERTRDAVTICSIALAFMGAGVADRGLLIQGLMIAMTAVTIAWLVNRG